MHFIYLFKNLSVTVALKDIVYFIGSKKKVFYFYFFSTQKMSEETEWMNDRVAGSKRNHLFLFYFLFFLFIFL
jgi:cytochrome b561